MRSYWCSGITNPAASGENSSPARDAFPIGWTGNAPEQFDLLWPTLLRFIEAMTFGPSLRFQVPQRTVSGKDRLRPETSARTLVPFTSLDREAVVPICEFSRLVPDS